MNGKWYNAQEAESIRDLLRRGRERGFVTYAEMDRVVPSERLTAERLDAVIRALQADGIAIRQGVRSTPDYPAGVAVEAGGKRLLTQIPDTPLLTREGEVELARRIERAHSAIRDRIVASGAVLPELAVLLERLQSRTIRLECVTERPVRDGREAFRRRIERDLRRTVLLEHRYRNALGRGASLRARLRRNRREHIDNLELTCPFWLEVAKRIRRDAQRVENGRISRCGLCSKIGIGSRELRSLARDLSRDEEEAERARKDLVRSNIRLVMSFAHKYATGAVPMADLVQEGTIGLMRAADKFDFRRGFRFSTYATWWVRQGIRRAVAEKSRTIRLPVRISECTLRVAAATNELQRQFDRPPTDQEVAESAKLPVSTIRIIRGAVPTVFSTDTPAGEGDDRRLPDRVADDRALMGDEEADRKQRCFHARQLLATLTPREQKVLRMRYAVGRDREHTLKEIGQELGVSRERVRQIEAEAFLKLRALAETG